MKTPRYTDSFKYPNGYKRSGHSDVAATFRRIRAEQKAKAETSAANEVERSEKLRPLRRLAK